MALPIQPYFENAYDYFRKYIGGTGLEYEAWLVDQGRQFNLGTNINWLKIPFQSEEQELIFKLRWA